MRRSWAVLVGVGMLIAGGAQAWAQGLWGRGGSGIIQPPWNKHHVLQNLPSVPPAQAPAPPAQNLTQKAQPLSGQPLGTALPRPSSGRLGTGTHPAISAQQAWPPRNVQGFQPFGLSGQFAPSWNIQPAWTNSGAWSPWSQPAGMTTPGAFPTPPPPTTYHPPTAVYHGWSPYQAQQAMYQRTLPGAAPRTSLTPGGQAAASDSLPGVSIQRPQVLGTVDRSALEPRWWQRLRWLWPFGR